MTGRPGSAIATSVSARHACSTSVGRHGRPNFAAAWSLGAHGRASARRARRHQNLGPGMRSRPMQRTKSTVPLRRPSYDTGVWLRAVLGVARCVGGGSFRNEPVANSRDAGRMLPTSLAKVGRTRPEAHVAGRRNEAPEGRDPAKCTNHLHKSAGLHWGGWTAVTDGRLSSCCDIGGICPGPAAANHVLQRELNPHCAMLPDPPVKPDPHRRRPKPRMAGLLAAHSILAPGGPLLPSGRKL